MEYNQKSLGQQIKKCRLESNMSQNDLAEKAGLAKGYISTLELGKGRSISLKALDKLSMALSTDMDTLLSDCLRYYQKNQTPSSNQKILYKLESCSQKQLDIFLQILQSYVDMKKNQKNISD